MICRTLRGPDDLPAQISADTTHPWYHPITQGRVREVLIDGLAYGHVVHVDRAAGAAWVMVIGPTGRPAGTWRRGEGGEEEFHPELRMVRGKIDVIFTHGAFPCHGPEF